MTFVTQRRKSSVMMTILIIVFVFLISWYSILQPPLLPLPSVYIDQLTDINFTALPSSERVEEFYRSQAGQDKWIFETLLGSNIEKYRASRGFFIEFGARNGVADSNTYFFETFLGWNGILIEANPREQQQIAENRPESAVVNGAICEKEGDTITFIDPDVVGWGGIKTTYDTDRLADKESKGREFQVACHRLDTLVDYFGVSQVDLMTVDTEGSELMALKTFPFDRIKPKLIGVEILVGNTERDIYYKEVISFMESKGYKTFREHWVAINDTLDAFFTVDGSVPLFGEKPMSSYNRRLFYSKIQQCKNTKMCL